MTALVDRHDAGAPVPGPAGPTTDRGWLPMAAAFALTGAGQFATQILVARTLGPLRFGEVATLLNLLNLIGIPLVALQITVTGAVARGASSAPTMRRGLILGAVAAAVAVVTAPWWGGALAVGSLAAVRVTACFVPAALAVAVARGDAAGRTRTRAIAAAMSAAAVFRAVVAVAAAHRYGAPGVMVAAVGSEALVAVVLRIVVRPRDPRPEDRPVRWSELGGAAYSQIAMWLVVNVDLLWARRLLDGDDAGRYLAVGGVTVGLVSFGQAFLWHHAASSTDAAAGRVIVVRAAAVVGAAAGVGVPAAIVLLPRLLGARYGDLTGLLVLGGLWAVAASVVQTATATRVIAGRHGIVGLVPVAVAAIVAPPLWTAVLGDRPLVLSVAALVNTVVGAVVVTWGGWRTGRTRADGTSTGGRR